MSDKTELQIVLGGDYDPSKHAGRKFKMRSGNGSEYFDGCVWGRNGRYLSGNTNCDLIGLAADEPLRVGDFVFEISTKYVLRVRENVALSDARSLVSIGQVKRDPADYRFATAAEILAATGQPVKEEIEVGDTVVNHKLDCHRKGFPARVLQVTPNTLFVHFIHESRPSQMNWRDRINNQSWELISKGKKGQGDGGCAEASPGASPSKGGDLAASPCPACGGDRYLPDEWGRTAPGYRVPCAKCNFAAEKHETPLPPAPHHEIDEHGVCFVRSMSIRDICGNEADRAGLAARDKKRTEYAHAVRAFVKAKAEVERLGGAQ